MYNNIPTIFIHNGAESFDILVKMAVGLITQINTDSITLTNPIIEEIKMLM